jgi:hypothetical protein
MELAAVAASLLNEGVNEEGVAADGVADGQARAIELAQTKRGKKSKRVVVLSALVFLLLAFIVISQIITKFLTEVTENEKILSIVQSYLNNRGSCLSSPPAAASPES